MGWSPHKRNASRLQMSVDRLASVGHKELIKSLCLQQCMQVWLSARLSVSLSGLAAQHYPPLGWIQTFLPCPALPAAAELTPREEPPCADAVLPLLLRLEGGCLAIPAIQ